MGPLASRCRERNDLPNRGTHLLALSGRVVALHSLGRVTRNRARDKVVNLKGRDGYFDELLEALDREAKPDAPKPAAP
jgi:hypothetical protein